MGLQWKGALFNSRSTVFISKPEVERSVLPLRNLFVAALVIAASLAAGCFESSDGVDAADALDGNASKKDLLANLTDKLGGVNSTTAATGNETHLPHVHDYWAGRDRVLLADEAVEMNPWMTFDYVFWLREPAVGGAYWELPQGKTIYQGTGKLDLTLTWSDATIANLAMSYRHASSLEWSEFLPVTSGTPVSIDVTPAMTDLPHSGGSRWSFIFKAATAPGPALGAANLKAEIVRVGDLHAFPAHKNYFADAESLVIMDADTESKNSGWTTGITNFASGSNGPSDDGFTLPEGSIVPPGTAALILDLKVKDIPAQEVYLGYRDASGRFDRAEPIESSEPGVFRFVIPVEPDGVDSYYAALSSWRFFVDAYGGSAVGMAGPIQCGGCQDTTIALHALIEAFDDSPFEERAPPEGAGNTRPLEALGLL